MKGDIVTGARNLDVDVLGRHYTVRHTNYIKCCTMLIRDTFKGRCRFGYFKPYSFFR